MNEKMTKISLAVSVEEREALRALAERELRDPRDHLRHLLRRELRRKRLLTSSKQKNNAGAATSTQSTSVMAVNNR